MNPKSLNHCVKTPNGIRHQALGEACGYAVTENQCMLLSYFLHAIFGEKHSHNTKMCSQNRWLRSFLCEYIEPELF